MKKGLNTFVGLLLALIMIVPISLFMSVPAQAKANIPVVMSTANGDTVEWSSKVGSNDGYWEITAENSDYAVCICSGVTDHEAGTYEWSDLETPCFIADKSAGVPFLFTDGSCTVTVNGEAVNVSGVFEAEDGNHYAVDITYGTPSVSFTKVTDGSQITADNIGKCTHDWMKAWTISNWDVVTNTSANYMEKCSYRTTIQLGRSMTAVQERGT